jgi:hypothetical protein
VLLGPVIRRFRNVALSDFRFRGHGAVSLSRDSPLAIPVPDTLAKLGRSHDRMG